LFGVHRSEWVYWETLSLAIGKLGVTALAVHTVPTQVITVSFMLPLGLGIALAIRLGSSLPVSVPHAKHLVLATLIVGTLIFSVLSWFLYHYRTSIFRIFTDDPDVMMGCERIWWQVCVYYSQLSIYALNMGIATGLGMQWTLGAITFCFLWVVGLPAAWYIGVYRMASLEVTWSFIYPPYIFMNCILLVAFVCKDWDAVQRDILARETEELDGEMDTEVLVLKAEHDYGSLQN